MDEIFEIFDVFDIFDDYDVCEIRELVQYCKFTTHHCKFPAIDAVDKRSRALPPMRQPLKMSDNMRIVVDFRLRRSSCAALRQQA